MCYHGSVEFKRYAEPLMVPLFVWRVCFGYTEKKNIGIETGRV